MNVIWLKNGGSKTYHAYRPAPLNDVSLCGHAAPAAHNTVHMRGDSFDQNCVKCRESVARGGGPAQESLL